MERLKIVNSDVSVVFESDLNSLLEELEKQGATYTINFQGGSEYKHCAYVLFSVSDHTNFQGQKQIKNVVRGYCRYNCKFFEDRGVRGYCRFREIEIMSHRVLCDEVSGIEQALYDIHEVYQHGRGSHVKDDSARQRRGF